MVKAYLRYAKSASFGVIASGSSNTVYDLSGKLAICPALEDVIIWHVKQGTQVARWHDDDVKAEVTCITRCCSVDKKKDAEMEEYAVGYADGSVRIWSLKTNSCRITFNGHKSAVSALHFNRDNSLLVSGSKDSDLIVWDCIAENGLYRLRGHKDQITAIKFIYCDENNHNAPTHILSSSKDTLIKAWDLSTQHCVETLLGHRSEVWSMTMAEDQSFIITGTSDMELKVWKMDLSVLQQKISSESSPDTTGSLTEPEAQKLAITLFGAIPRSSKDRVVQLSIHPSQRFFACQSNDRSVEIFKIRTDAEMNKKLNKKKRKRETKGETDPSPSSEIVPKASDQFISHRVIRASAKIRSFDFRDSMDDNIVILCALANNSIEVYSMKIDSPEASVLSVLDIQGHRSDIRAMALSSDDEMLLTAGNASIKIWNTHTHQCVRTMMLPDVYVVCCAWIPGNRYIIAGTKSGHALLFDTWSSSLLETVSAHQGTLWSIDVRPDKKGLVTAGADKEVKFWDFGAIVQEEQAETSKRLTIVHSRTLQLTDEVLCVKYSADQKLVAVSLLDSTVKVFYEDTLKFFLNLYGHKLPVLTMDISSDNTLLITGSADKNIKIWGLDFGDCHKSIFAHSDSVMQVRFVPQTHYFFSCSKDKTVKYWDGDKFEQIMKLEGHHGELWSLAVGRWGNIVASAGHDKGVRLWEKTDEQLFLEEEREKEMEDAYLDDIVKDQQAVDEDGNEIGAASKKTAETLKSGERIMEAINLMDEEMEKLAAYHDSQSKGIPASLPEPNPILKAHGGIKPEKYVLTILQKIPSADLEEALLVLPFGNILSLLQAVNVWAKNEWNINLTCRVLVFIVNTYLNSLTASGSIQIPSRHSTNQSTKTVAVRPLIDSIRVNIHAVIDKQKSRIGFNLSGMKILKSLWEQEHTNDFVDWENQLSQRVSDVRKSEEKRPNKKQRKALIVKMTSDAIA